MTGIIGTGTDYGGFGTGTSDLSGDAFTIGLSFAAADNFYFSAGDTSAMAVYSNYTGYVTVDGVTTQLPATMGQGPVGIWYQAGGLNQITMNDNSVSVTYDSTTEDFLTSLDFNQTVSHAAPDACDSPCVVDYGWASVTLGDGSYFEIDNHILNGSGASISLNESVPAPEPAAFLVFGSALLALGAARRCGPRDRPAAP